MSVDYNQISVYALTPNLWRWEFRYAGALLRCGTAPTRVAAEMDVNQVVTSKTRGRTMPRSKGLHEV
jgi:hypothetical protein